MPEELKALSFEFWKLVIEDLQAGDEETRLWLDTGREPTGFLWWAEVTEKDAAKWRLMLVRLYEQGVDYVN